jgi:hypothetical protein
MGLSKNLASSLENNFAMWMNMPKFTQVHLAYVTCAEFITLHETRAAVCAEKERFPAVLHKSHTDFKCTDEDTN